jgi:hypothetical protein
VPVEVDPPAKIAWDSRDDWAQVLSHFVESGRTDFKPISTTPRGWAIIRHFGKYNGSLIRPPRRFSGFTMDELILHFSKMRRHLSFSSPRKSSIHSTISFVDS